MNIIILSAIMGVVMMFSSVLVKSKAAYKHIAAIGLLALLVFNVAESHGYQLFHIDTTNFLHFEKFGLLFNSVCLVCYAYICIAKWQRY